MSDVIEFEDIFGKDAFEKGVQGVAALTNGFKEMAVQLGKVAAEQKEFLQGLKINNSDDIKKLTAELQKAQKTIVDLNNANAASKQGEIELAKLRQANAKALQEEEKAQQQKLKTEKAANQNKEKTLTLYQQESKLLRDLKNEYKNVALAQGQTSKAAQDLLAKITPLDAKLKQLDKTTGDNFRNVGNYQSALKGAAGAITNVLGAAGIGIGLSAGIDFLKESFAEFAKAEKATKELGFALTNISGEGTPALERLSAQAEKLEETLGLFEAEDIMLLQKELVNLGASSEQVEALTPKILDLAKASGMDLATATDVAIKAINGQTKGLKSVGLEFTDTGSKAENYNILLEKLDKFQGAAANSATTLEGKQQRMTIAWGNIKESVGSFLTNEGARLLDYYDTLSGKMSVEDLNNSILMDGLSESANAISDFRKAAAGAAEDALKTGAVGGQKLLDSINEDAKKLNNDLKNGIIDITEFEDEMFYVIARRQELSAELDRLAALRSKKKPKGLTGGSENGTEKETSKKETDDAAKLTKQIEDAKAQSFTNDQEREEAKAKLDYERKLNDIKTSKLFVKNEKLRNEAITALDLEYYNTRADIENKYIDEKDKRDKAEKDKAKKEDEAAFDAAVKYAKELTDKEDKEREEKNKKEKEAKEKELKDLFDTTNKALELAEKKIKAEEKLLQDALDNEIDLRQRNIDEQKRRAEQGLTNTLAFEEKALKDAEARKAEEEKKAVKREKTISFFKLLSANAEKDPANALQKTLTEILLAEAISGAFFKGTERVSDDLQGNKVHNGRDGYVVAVDGSERVLTGEQNKLIGNMSNEDLAKLAHDYKNNKLLPNYMLNEGLSSSVSENIYASMQLTQMVKMNERLESLEEAIKNKPVSNVNIDNLGNIIKQEIRNGLLITTKKPLTRGY